jgi:hypothetical protein
MKAYRRSRDILESTLRWASVVNLTPSPGKETMCHLTEVWVSSTAGWNVLQNRKIFVAIRFEPQTIQLVQKTLF